MKKVRVSQLQCACCGWGQPRFAKLLAVREDTGRSQYGTLGTLLTLLTLATFLVAGCVNSTHRLVLDPVGPSPIQSSATGTDGSLVVFSALDPHAHFNGYPYRRYYTGYKILSSDGKLLRAVQNDNGRLTEGPARVTLSPGTYQVVARANGRGEVVVPVVIAAHQVTAVHLDGGLPPRVGWRSNDVASHQ